MDSQREYLHELNSPDALLDEAARAAISHAQKHRTGVRGWKPSQLIWKVEDQLWDENLGCNVVVIAAQPFRQPEAPQALWEYWLDDQGKIMPGFPTVKNMPDWGVPEAPALGPRIEGPRPTKRDAITLIVAIAVAAMIVSGALAWLAVDPTGDDETSVPGAVIFPAAAPLTSSTSTPRPAPSPAPALTLLPTSTAVVERRVAVVTPIPLVPTPSFALFAPAPTLVPASTATASNISFSQETGISGDRVIIAGSGFPSFSQVEGLTIGGVPALVTLAITDASGNIVTEFTVPQSAPAGVQILEITIGGVTRRTRFEIASPSLTATLTPAPVLAPTRSFSGSIFFEDDFEGGATDGWSNGTTNTAHTDHFTEFLGNFGNDIVSLTLIGLPTHSVVELRFDLYLLDSWDGDGTNCPTCGPDYFGVGHGTSLENLLLGTFGGRNQSYNATRPVLSCEHLGFNPEYCDTIYKNLNNAFRFIHTGNSLTLNFSAMGLQGLLDESWGIDNVRVAVALDPDVLPTAGTPAPAPTPAQVFGQAYLDTGLAPYPGLHRRHR